jgi:hypothetical protein
MCKEAVTFNLTCDDDVLPDKTWTTEGQEHTRPHMKERANGLKYINWTYLFTGSPEGWLGKLGLARSVVATVALWILGPGAICPPSLGAMAMG